MSDLYRVLFVCTGNAGRSQMAQVMFRNLAQGQVIVESAGVEPWDRLHPMAIRIMSERGLDLRGHYPKPVSAVMDQVFDIVVTIGELARTRLFTSMPGDPQRIHWDISDPADADNTLQSESVFRYTAQVIEQQLPELLETVAVICTKFCQSTKGVNIPSRRYKR